MANGHAFRNPSGAEKWMTCLGSLAMEEGLPDKGSDYADEGTAAHFLASTCLTGDIDDPVYYIGREIDVWTHPESDSSGTCFKDDSSPDPAVQHNLFKVDVDMAGYVRTYCKKVREYATSGTLMVEQEVPLDHLTGETGATGTTDALVLDGDWLTIDDLKYGYTPVPALKNKQLLMYASGALEHMSVMGVTPKHFRLVIHQPRVAHDPDVWECTLEDIREFEKECRQAATDSKIAYEHRVNWLDQSTEYLPADDSKGYPYLTPSEKACKWCRAYAVCPAAAKLVETVMEANFEKLATTTVEPAAALTQMVARGGEITLTEKMNAVDMIEDWCKAVRAEVERRLFADPASVPGYKVVQGKKGNRKWRDEEEAEKALKEMRIKHDLMYDYKLISPPQAEKVFKTGGIGPRQWPKLQEMITQADGLPSVARADDPRLPPPSIAEKFDVVAGGEDLC